MFSRHRVLLLQNQPRHKATAGASGRLSTRAPIFIGAGLATALVGYTALCYSKEPEGALAITAEELTPPRAIAAPDEAPIAWPNAKWNTVLHPSSAAVSEATFKPEPVPVRMAHSTVAEPVKQPPLTPGRQRRAPEPAKPPPASAPYSVAAPREYERLDFPLQTYRALAHSFWDPTSRSGSAPENAPQSNTPSPPQSGARAESNERVPTERNTAPVEYTTPGPPGRVPGTMRATSEDLSRLMDNRQVESSKQTQEQGRRWRAETANQPYVTQSVSEPMWSLQRESTNEAKRNAERLGELPPAH
jgi:hypothetical protein